MDKPKQNIAKHVAHKKGFALLLTLSILGIVIALSSVLVGYMSTARESAVTTKALIQGNIFYADIQQVLKRFKNKKSLLYETLYKTPIPFEMGNGRFGVILKCQPIANGVNINWLLYENNSKMQAQYNVVKKVLEYLAQSYNIVNINLLEEMIVNKIKNINNTSDFIDRLNDKKLILSYSEFENILFKYSQEENDRNIIKIPWKSYFVFNKINNDPKKNIIDGNYISSELLSVLTDIDIASVEDEWEAGKSKLNSFLNNNGVQLDKKLFTSKFYPQTRCEVYYDYMDNRFKFTFDDINNEVKDFEFYGRQ